MARWSVTSIPCSGGARVIPQGQPGRGFQEFERPAHFEAIIQFALLLRRQTPRIGFGGQLPDPFGVRVCQVKPERSTGSTGERSPISGRMARFQISVSVAVTAAFMDMGCFTVRSGATAGRVRGTISPARKPVVHQRGAALSQHRDRQSTAEKQTGLGNHHPRDGRRVGGTANTHHRGVAK